VKALVVYESFWGNTEAVAQAIAGGISESMDVDVFDVCDAEGCVADADFVVVGGLTHVLSMSRPGTRADAVRQGGARGGTDRGVREWLAALPTGDGSRCVFTFDTRLRRMRHLPGAAARSEARSARRRGYPTPWSAHSFYVVDVQGPLVDGELERAREWGRHLAAGVWEGARVR
jgi:hypothetical protein